VFQPGSAVEYVGWSTQGVVVFCWFHIIQFERQMRNVELRVP